MGYHRQSLSSRGNFGLFETLESRRMMARVLGIDVSDVQGTIDWAQVAASGRQFAFVHASSGGTTGDYDPTTATGTESERYDDANVIANVAGAQAAGLEVGVYHVARADILTNTGVDEAQHLLDVAGDFIGDGYLPPVLELTTGSARSRTALTNWAADFADTIFTASGVIPIIYIDSTYANSEVNDSLAYFPLFLTRPTAAVDPAVSNPAPISPALSNVYGVWNPSFPTIPNPQPWSFWQYNTTNGQVNGVAGAVNLDVFNGTLRQLREGFLQGYVPPTDPNLAIQVTLNSSVISDGDTEDFGSLIQGAAFPTMTFTVKNISDEPVLLNNLHLVGGAPFSITDVLPPYLLPGQADTFIVRLNTGATGTGLSDTLQFDLDGPVTTTFTVNFTGQVDALASGAVYGTLFEDVNGDGLRQPGENGLAGWTVTAHVAGGDDITTTTSDAGQYIFNDIPTTAIGQLVTIEAEQSQPDPDWYPTAPGTGGTPLYINVFPNSLSRARDLGFAHVASLSGQIFLDVDHNALYDDTADSPLADWLVYIDLNHNGLLDPFENTPSNTARSDDTGFYQFTDLHAAPYLLFRVLPTPGYAAANTSYYAVNLFSNDDIQDKDFGFRSLLPPDPVPPHTY